MSDSSSWGYNYPSAKEERERLRKQEQAERERKKRDLDDIDGDINWAYSQMRIVEAWLESAIEEGGAALSEKDQKRIDKALVVARTGMKMLKKVVKSRAPHLDTAAWKSEQRGLLS
jgi:hypothetical protein